uniref:phenylalanine-tRNA ligase beta subunit n=1 Tax=Cocconeiopsis kantsiensis TaxID=3082010 RepID=UPI003002173C
MQISLKWINELVNIETIKLDDLIDKLTLGGFEVEEVFEVEINNKKEIVLDISATANRSDSLSIHGISTEIACLLNKPFKKSNYLLKNTSWNRVIEETAETLPSHSDCSIFLAVTIENLTDLKVPKWITQKLISSGIIPSNDLTDFQNYILLETGYPFAFYDFEKISSQVAASNFTLSIEKASETDRFVAGNGFQYELDNSVLIIKANQTPIGLAGLIEAKDFSISESTTKVLIEGSIFNAAKIRQQSRALNLRSDRSARYEKSLRNTFLIEAFNRLISLLRISNPTLTCQLHTSKKLKEDNVDPIFLRYETINEILGPIDTSTEEKADYITPITINNYLNRLNFQYHYDNLKLVWKVEIPHSRAEDITREIDLIEEIGRLHGFNNFLTTLPKIKTIGYEDSTYKTRKKITSCLLNLGLNEFIHYSLVNQQTFLTNEIELINPLLSDCSSLRSSLLPNLVKTVQENLKQKNLPIEGFEYGHVFSSDSKTKFKEKEYVAGIFGGIKTKPSWTNSETAMTWFEAKGKIEQLLKQFNVATYWEKCTDSTTKKLLHPYRSAFIYLTNGNSLGKFGQINPILASQLNISPELYLFEFDIETIEHQLQKNKLTFYKSYSTYPKIVKDISFIIPKEIPFNKIQETLYSNGTEFLSQINLLDEYRGQSIPENYTSLCLQLVFQAPDRTLENKEIETIIQNLQLILTQKFDVTLRS